MERPIGHTFRDSVARDNARVHYGDIYYAPGSDPVAEWLRNSAADLSPLNSLPVDLQARLSDQIFSEAQDQGILEKKGQSLVLVGAPGVGKTVTMQALIRRISKIREPSTVAVGYIFFSQRRQLSQGLEPVLLHLLRIFNANVGDASNSTKRLYREHGTSDALEMPDSDAILDALVEVINRSARACIVIDSLDECHPANSLDPILGWVRKLQKRTGIGILLTDRPGESRARERHFAPSSTCRLREVCTNEEDLKAYVEDSVKRYGSTADGNANTWASAVKIICKASAGMFLLAKLHVGFLEPQTLDTRSFSKNLAMIEATGHSSLGLKRTPYTRLSQTYHDTVLEEAYRTNVDRMMDKSVGRTMPQLAQKTLSILLAAKRSLTVKELQHALCAVYDLEEPPDYSAPLSWEALQRICCAMITEDEEGNVNAIHSTLGLFLERENRENADSSEVMLHACLRYLAMDELSSGICLSVETLWRRIAIWPFLSYVACNWQNHLGHSTRGDHECTSRCGLASDFLGRENNTKAAYQIVATSGIMMERAPSCSLSTYRPSGRGPFSIFDSHRRGSDAFIQSRLDRDYTTGLHWACSLGCSLLFKQLIAACQDFDICDWNSQSLLHCAVGGGNLEIIRALLGLGATPDSCDVLEMTPLACASRLGHTAVVELLLGLGRQVDPNSTKTNSIKGSLSVDNDQTNQYELEGMLYVSGRTPLHHAARDGHVETARLLLRDQRTDVNHLDVHGFTALHRAAKKGHLDVVALLARHEKIKVTRRVCERDDGTFGVVKGLSQHPGDTFLHLASRYSRSGNHAVVRYAIREHPGLTNIQGQYGQTPLHCAVESQASNNVEAFMEASSIDVNAQDHRMQTPLHLSLDLPDPTVFELLLDHPNIRVDLEDWMGLTPLGKALAMRNEVAFKTLYRQWGPRRWAVVKQSHKERFDWELPSGLLRTHTPLSSFRKRSIKELYYTLAGGRAAR